MIVAVLLACPLVSQEAGQGGALKGRPLSYWVKQVSRSRPGAAREALLVLTEVGPQAAAGAPAVVRAIRRRDIAPDALRALLAIGVIPKRAVEPVLKCLNHKSTRGLAIEVLGRMGALAREARPALIRLTHVGSQREAAFKALDKIGVDTVELLCEDLHADKQWRTDALRRVGRLGVEAKQAVPELIRILGFYPRLVSEIGGLKSKGAAQAAAKARRAFAVRSEKAARDRALAAQVLGGIGAPSRALPALRKAALDFDAEVAKSAIWALMIHGSREAVPILTKAMDRPRAKNLDFLAAGLVSFGPASQRAVLTLKKLARRPGKVGVVSAKAVAQIERSLGFLKRCRSGDIAQSRAATPKLLPYGPAVLPAVVSALQRGDAALNRAVIRQVASHPRRFLDLGAAQPAYPGVPRLLLDPVPFVPLLIEFVQDQDVELASSCCVALGVIGVPRAEHAIAVLREVLIETGNQPRLRLAACEALFAFGALSGVPDAAFLAMPDYLRARDPLVVQRCTRLLGLLGDRADVCVPPLIGMLGEGGPGVAGAGEARGHRRRARGRDRRHLRGARRPQAGRRRAAIGWAAHVQRGQR